MEDDVRPSQISGHDSKELIRELKTTREIASTSRVYRKEWLHTAGSANEADLREYAQVRFEGRVAPEDIRVRESSYFEGHYVLEVRRWNVVSEWKWPRLAEEHAAKLRGLGDDVEVVARNSRREHELRNYGVLKV